MKKRRYLIIGAHPDDPDIRFGGTAIKLIRAGHIVKFVSLTNGCCGHHIQSGKKLTDRHYAGTQAAKELIGLAEYEVWRARKAIFTFFRKGACILFHPVIKYSIGQ